MRFTGGLAFAALSAILAVGAGAPSAPSPTPQEAGTSAATPTLDIKVDQAGYLPGAPKVALVVSKAAAGSLRSPARKSWMAMGWTRWPAVVLIGYPRPRIVARPGRVRESGMLRGFLRGS